MLSRYGFKFEEKDKWENIFGYIPTETASIFNQAYVRLLAGKIFSFSTLAMQASGSDGIIWSRNSGQTQYAFYSQFHVSHVYPNIRFDRFYGVSRRQRNKKCVD